MIKKESYLTYLTIECETFSRYLTMSYLIYLPTYILRGAHLVQTLLNLAPSQSSPPAVMQYEYLYLFTLGSFNNALECARALFL